MAVYPVMQSHLVFVCLYSLAFQRAYQKQSAYLRVHIIPVSRSSWTSKGTHSSNYVVIGYP